jgi:hypothetical protein
MKITWISFGGCTRATLALLAVLSGADPVLGQPPAAVSDDRATTSVEQGQTPLTDSFETAREWRIEKRRQALKDTQFRFNIRSFYFDRDKFDDSDSQAFTIGGWAGVKTGYFLDHISFGVTGYTSLKLSGDKNKDGTLLLKPGQDSYAVLGEAYVDIRIVDDLNLYVGRKEFDSPFINRNDTRMTPNTFEAIVLQGKAKFGENGGTLKYGAGYFDKIKERDSDEFVSMSEDAGAIVHRGVYVLGGVYEKGNFSFGAIDYYSPDIINIGYAEAKLTIPINDSWKPKLAVQFTDQRSVGDNELQGESFSTQQFGIKVELPVNKALFTLGYTQNDDGTNVQSPWSGYPGYTGVQVQDFNRAGEGAFLVRAGYDFAKIKGLSTYALGVFGTQPDDIGQFRQNEYDANLQWAPPEGVLKGLSVRLRYAVVQQKGGDVDNIKDFRVICNYAIQF